MTCAFCTPSPVSSPCRTGGPYALHATKQKHAIVLQGVTEQGHAHARAPLHCITHPVVLLRLCDDATQGLPCAVRPACKPHLAADALEHAEAHFQLLRRLLQGM